MHECPPFLAVEGHLVSIMVTSVEQSMIRLNAFIIANRNYDVETCSVKHFEKSSRALLFYLRILQLCLAARHLV